MIPRTASLLHNANVPATQVTFREETLLPKVWQTLSLLSFPFAKPSTSLLPYQEQVSHFLCSGIPFSGSFPAYPSLPHFKFPLGTSLLLSCKLVLQSLHCSSIIIYYCALQLHYFSPWAQCVRTAPSVCLSAWNRYRGCLQ